MKWWGVIYSLSFLYFRSHCLKIFFPWACFDGNYILHDIVKEPSFLVQLDVFLMFLLNSKQLGDDINKNTWSMKTCGHNEHWGPATCSQEQRSVNALGVPAPAGCLSPLSPASTALLNFVFATPLYFFTFSLWVCILKPSCKILNFVLLESYWNLCVCFFLT